MRTLFIKKTFIQPRIKLMFVVYGVAGILPAYSIKQKPNIILFLVDDMGWQDTSVPFYSELTTQNRIFHTPNMERLAKMGVKFTHAYACPVSTPTRVSLLTGANATQTHVTNWTMYKDKPTDKSDPTLSFDRWNYNGLCVQPHKPHSFYAETFTHLLQQHGYDTYLVGKAHLGAYGTRGAGLESFGFTKNIAAHIAGSPGSYLSEKNYGNKEKGKYTPPWGVPDLEKYHGSGLFLTDALTMEAIRLMSESLKNKHPFFMYLSHYAVHTNYEPDKRYVPKYLAMGLSQKEAEYCGLIEGMDKSLGDVLDFVDKQGIVANTRIVFLSDNGGYTGANRPDAYEKNAPLSGGKSSCFEGGIRVPMIIYNKGIHAGEVNDSPVIVEDLFPTFLEMAGISNYKTIQHIDGQSILPALTTGKIINPNRMLFFHYPNNWGERYNKLVGSPQSALIAGDYKLIYLYENDSTLLFNIKTDISEKHNLAGISRYSSIRSHLAKVLSEKLRDANPNMPIVKQTGKRVKYPDGK